MEPNTKLIKKKVKSLHVPKEYWGIDIDSFFEYQWNIYLSIRETAGKTTQSLIYGLVLNSLYPDKYCIEYLRNDKEQITRGNIETIFDTVVKFGYIEKIYNGRWNNITYKPHIHKFFLCTKDADGNIIDEDDDAICIVHCLENAVQFKSGYVNNRGNYIVLDEVADSKQASYTLFAKLLTCISTIGRPFSKGRTEWLHILVLGNNTNEYLWLFDDFGIAKEIPTLKFGGSIPFRTEYNTTGICRLLELGEVQKKRLQDKNIPFLGFPGKKAAQFTGVTEWSGKSYRHLDQELDYHNCIFRRIYIRHRERFIQLELFREEEKGKFVFCHFSNAPKYDDNILLTIEPESAADIYGFGKYTKNEKIKRVMTEFTKCFQENRVYYASNNVGSLVDDFISNID